MENINNESMVTIPLGEYNRLRDEAMMNRLMMDKIIMFETRMNDLQRQLYDMNK